MRIVVLDNDQRQADLICKVLTSTGHSCHAFYSAKDLLLQLGKESYDMLILDWQIPDLSGAEVLRQSRDHLPMNMPVLVLTSRSGENDIVAGMDAGANDYMIKPLRRSELVARVQALLRRAYPEVQTTSKYDFGDYVFEMHAGRLLQKGNVVDLTQKEFALALLFFRHLGRPLSRTFIHETIWSRDVELASRTMDTHVSRVRNKLSLRPEHGYRLAPVYSYGYRLEQIGSQAATPGETVATTERPLSTTT